MATLTVDLTPELRAGLDELLRRGEYTSEEDVVREGLRRVFTDHEETERLRELVREGVEDLLAGRMSTVTAEQVKTRGRARLAGRSIAP